MATGLRQARAVAREIGHQRRGDVFLHDLICFLDSIAECREEYTSEDIRQQPSDDTATRGPVDMVGIASVLTPLQHGFQTYLPVIYSVHTACLLLLRSNPDDRNH